MSSTTKAADNSMSTFPLARLLPTADLVVAYSKEFVDEFSSSPKGKAKRKRYALIFNSATADAKTDIERYFGTVVNDILSVRQVSLRVYIICKRHGRYSSRLRLNKLSRFPIIN